MNVVNELIPHPAVTRPRVDLGLTATIARPPSGSLRFSFELSGGLDDVLIAEVEPSRAVEGLWDRTCFEAFVGPVGRDCYVEFNFSPSTCWYAYSFSGYRKKTSGAELSRAPEISVDRRGDTLELIVTIAAELCEGAVALAPNAPLRVGLSAVLKHRDGTQSYWALKHADAKPDFHNVDSFVLVLPALAECETA